MHSLMQFIREFTVWLHHPLVECGWFYLDLWSLAHFWSGAMVFTGLTVLEWKNRWRWLAFFLTAFEVVEATIFISILKLFRPEKLPDCFTDVFVGMAGGYLVWFLFEKRKIPNYYRNLFVFWATACTVSFFWTGNYGYIFRDTLHSAPGINWWVFILWIAAGIGILYLFNRIKKLNYTFLKTVALTWILYFLPFLVLYSCSPELLFGKEIQNDKLTDMQSFFTAERTATIFYLTSPILFISLGYLLDSLFKRYFQKCNRIENE